jgi:Transglycosylase SLT domain
VLNAGVPIHWSQQNAAEIVTASEVHYAIPHHELFDTLTCESGLNPKAINPHDSHGGSYGIAQINAAHTELTRAQMFDPIFSINWSAQQFAAGHQHIWSCYKGEDTS